MTQPADPAGSTGTLSDHDFAAPIDDRYLEDYVPGAVTRARTCPRGAGRRPAG